MNKPYKVSLSIGEIFSVKDNDTQTEIEKVNEEQIMRGKTKCFADGLNKNNYYFTLSGMKKAAPTIRGKPFLVHFNLFHSDGLGDHDSNEIAVGYVPDNAEITFEKADDGRTFLCTDVAIWKFYSKELPEILKNAEDNKKEVSVELLVIDSEEQSDYTVIKEFVFCGITILSQDISPAIKNAEMQILKFSNKAKSVFEKLEDFLKFSKEENMTEKEKIENSEKPKDTLENATKVTDVSVRVDTGECIYNDDGSRILTDESHRVSTTVVEEVPDVPIHSKEETVNNAHKDNEQEDESCEKNDNSCENSENEPEKIENSVNDDIQQKFSSLQNEYTILKNSYNDLMQKYSVLEKFKKNKDNETKLQAIECALNDVSDTLSGDEISEWREKAKTFSNVDDFRNTLKAFAYDVQKSKGVETSQSLRSSIPQTYEKKSDSNSLWGSLENY